MHSLPARLTLLLSAVTAACIVGTGVSSAAKGLAGPRYLAFTSDRSGGKGGMDVYIHDRLTSQMVPLPSLNSANDELRPVIGAGATMLACTSNRSAPTGSALLYDVFGQKLTDIPGLDASPSAIDPALSGGGDVFAFSHASGKARPADSEVVVFSRPLGRYLTPARLNDQAGSRSDVALSPDGGWFAYVYRNASPAVPGTVVLHDLLRGASFTIPAQGMPGECAHPSVSRDGRFVSFASRATADPRAWDLYVYDRGKQKLLSTPGLNSSEADERSSLSPDGRYLALESRRGGSWDILLYDLRERLFVDLPGLNTAGTERHPALSQE